MHQNLLPTGKIGFLRDLDYFICSLVEISLANYFLMLESVKLQINFLLTLKANCLRAHDTKEKQISQRKNKLLKHQRL